MMGGYSVMQQPSDDLIFDRTAADVARVKVLEQKIIMGSATEQEQQQWLSGRMKGAWNASDAQRVEAWTDYLADQLQTCGYDISTYPDTWEPDEFFLRSKMDQLRRGIEALRNGFFAIPDWREIQYENTLDYSQANAYEWDLQQVEGWSSALIQGFQLRQANTMFMIAGGVFHA